MTQFTRAKKGVLVAAALMLGAGAAQAADRAPVLKAVVDCRAITDGAARLA